MTVKVGDPYLVINGRYLYISGRVKGWADGTALVPARTLATALGAWIDWTGTVDLYSGGVPLTAADRPYDDTTLDLLARVITHESGNQPLEGKMAVGNVILNRVNSRSFPNTVYDVIFSPNQFPGATNATPNAESILAARLVLEGANVVPGAYYFNGTGKSCWASRNKKLITVIGGHAFYG
jgi:N-acetylmuramoyl-L-alanine amidase